MPPLLDGSVEVELTATDGRTIDGAWREDGGRTIQRYRIDVVPMIIPDAAPPEPDAYIPSFRDIQGDRLGCASDPGQRAPWSLIILTAIVALAWRRQRGR